MRRTNVLLTGLLLAGLLPGAEPGLVGQERAFGVVQSPRGWLGVSLNAEIVGGGSSASMLTIAMVMDGSPAEAAGLRTGDQILAINGFEIDNNSMSLLRTDPGDVLQLTVATPGQDPREVELVSVARPQMVNFSTADAAVWEVRLDSMRNRILLAADSLQLEGRFRAISPGSQWVVAEGEDGAHVTVNVTGAAEAQSVVVETLGDGSAVEYRWKIPEPSESAPFGVFLRRTEETSALLAERTQLQTQRSEVRRAELARERALLAELPPDQRAIDPDDPRLVGLRQTGIRLDEQIQELNEKLARASLEALAEPVAPVAGAQPSIEVTVMEEAPRVRRVFSYLHEAERFMAGAELAPLNESLALYFPVEEGILVTEVVEGSPAGDAGLTAGDIIIRVGGYAVIDMEGIREAISFLGPDEDLVLTVISRDGQRTVTVPR